jgi:hypothetical protein
VRSCFEVFIETNITCNQILISIVDFETTIFSHFKIICMHVLTSFIFFRSLLALTCMHTPTVLYNYCSLEVNGESFYPFSLHRAGGCTRRAPACRSVDDLRALLAQL